MTQIVFLGVGGAMTQAPADNHSAFLLRAGESTILLDCGPTIMRQLERAGVGAEELTHVYISHQHGDHSLGMPMLALNRALLWPERLLTVLAAPDVLEAARGLVAIAYPDLMNLIEPAIRFAPLARAPWPLPLPFDSTITYQLAHGDHSVQMWAIRLALSSGQSLVFSGDTGPSENVARLAADATLLVHDSFHLKPPATGPQVHSSASQVGEIARQAGVRSVALVHRMDASAQAAAAYRAMAAQHFDGDILVPQAGDVVIL